MTTECLCLLTRCFQLERKHLTVFCKIKICTHNYQNQRKYLSAQADSDVTKTWTIKNYEINFWGNSKIDSELYHLNWIGLSLRKWNHHNFGTNMNFSVEKLDRLHSISQNFMARNMNHIVLYQRDCKHMICVEMAKAESTPYHLEDCSP